MSDKSENGADLFTNAFKSFGRNLKLPSVTIEDVVNHHRKNIRALEAAAQNTTKGAQAIMNEQRKQLENALADITHMVQDARDGGLNKENARDVVADQAEFAKKAFESTIQNATSMGEVLRNVSTENMNVLKTRVQESIEEIKSAMDSGKSDGGGDEPPIKPS
ncbi:phasin family protein [Pseudahrensia aquimaris]|uniref:Phasin family protein n=1 Tax=Pseudahrensia aquimaris TaxID=744461 RepID=A0ABW3FHM8_9HYPH